MKALKKNFYLILSIAFVVIGVLGLLGVGFFSSNVVLEIIEIVLGALGLLFSFGKL